MLYQPSTQLKTARRTSVTLRQALVVMSSRLMVAKNDSATALDDAFDYA